MWTTGDLFQDVWLTNLLNRHRERGDAKQPTPCPNCGELAYDFYKHSADCELCDSELDITHCGCFHEEQSRQDLDQ